MRPMGPFVDICGNLLACQFTSGIYNGKVRHTPDLLQVLERAKEAGVKAIITASGMNVCCRVRVRVVVVLGLVLLLKPIVMNLDRAM